MNKMRRFLTVVCIGFLNLGIYSSPVLAKEIKSITPWQDGKTITKIEDTQKDTISIVHTTFVKGNHDFLPMLEFTFSKLQQTDSGMYIGKDTCDVSNFPGEGKYHTETWRINGQHIKLTTKCVTRISTKVLVAHPKAWKPEHEQFVSLFKKSAQPITFQRLSYSKINTAVSAKGFTRAWSAKRFEIVKNSANKGDATAQYYLAHLYLNGAGVKQSDKKSAEWMRKAAEKGLPSAQYDLGVLYSYGRGVSQSDKDSVIWTKKAAEQGWVGAQYNLGHMYYEGRGVAQSDDNAIKWWLKVLESEPDAQDTNLSLAIIYMENGQYNKAKPYAKKAYQLSDSRSNEAVLYYGYCLLETGEPKVALDIMADAYRVAGDKVYIALAYAEALIANNKKALAKDVLAKIETEDRELIALKKEVEEKAN